MPSFAESAKSNASYNPDFRPVAIFVGGTSGIGQGTARRFAHHTKGSVHIIIIGRNKDAADETIAKFPKHRNSKYEFVPCDVSRISNVVKTCAELKSRLVTINYLVLSPGIFGFEGQQLTEEGLDVKMCLHFYSRWKFVDELMPLLQKASDIGQEARVMSILAAGFGSKVDVENIGLKKNYSMMLTIQQLPAYNDIFVEEYSKLYPKISFIHISPGFVDTPQMRSHWVLTLIKPLVFLFSVSAEKCGEWMLYGLLAPAYKTGGYHLDSNANPIDPAQILTTDEARDKLVDHYKQAIRV